MRVKGNLFPKTLLIEPYHPMPGYMEVRLRENVKEITETDSVSEQEITMFEYDEYTLHVKEKEGLYEEITANMDGWLITGRTLEVNENASAVVDMKDTIKQDAITIDRMNTAGAEAMQSLNAEPPVSAGVFTYGEWMPDTWYEQYALFTYNDNAGFVRQAHTSLAVYPPFSAGTEALYGARPSPDSEGIYPYVYNMKVEKGMKVYGKDGNVYVAINKADPLLHDPVDAVSVFERC